RPAGRDRDRRDRDDRGAPLRVRVPARLRDPLGLPGRLLRLVPGVLAAERPLLAGLRLLGDQEGHRRLRRGDARVRRRGARRALGPSTGPRRFRRRPPRRSLTSVGSAPHPITASGGPSRSATEGETMTALLTAYVLMWPVLVLGILITIARGFAKDAREARKEGRPII